MPVGVQIHNIELQKGKGGQLVRSAGTAARLVAKEGTYCHVELPSGELRLIHGECMATVGEDWKFCNINLVKSRESWKS